MAGGRRQRPDGAARSFIGDALVEDMFSASFIRALRSWIQCILGAPCTTKYTLKIHIASNCILFHRIELRDYPSPHTQLSSPRPDISLRLRNTRATSYPGEPAAGKYKELACVMQLIPLIKQSGISIIVLMIPGYVYYRFKRSEDLDDLVAMHYMHIN
jgi:hypothetical protein